MHENQTPELKKIYCLPTLRVYGSIEELTKTANAGVMADTRGLFMDMRSH